MLAWIHLLALASFAGTPVAGEVRVDGDVPGTELTVRLLGAGGELATFTDGDGAFTIADVDDGTWTLVVSGPDIFTATLDLQIAGTAPRLQVDVEGLGDQLQDELVVFGERSPPEITERVLDVQVIQVLPGTNGDAVRAVQNLPGIGRPPLNIGQLLVRGTAPEDSAYYIDGARVPQVFHFAGLSTVLNSDSLAEVAFLPGNYGVRYGRTLGGVVDLRTNRQLPAESRRYVSFDLFQGTAFLEQRLSPRTALTVSGRRSWVDAVLNPVLKGATGGGVQAPRYYDLQARLLHKSATAGTFDALVLLSDDSFRFIGPPDEGEEQGDTQIGLETTFQKLRLAHVYTTGQWTAETSLIGGPEAQSFAIAPSGEAFEKRMQMALRHEWANDSYGPVSWRLGVDAQVTRFSFLYDVPAISSREEGVVWTVAPAAYVEPTIEFGRFKAIPGVRMDGWWADSGYKRTPIDPRFALVYNDGGATKLKASAGRYSQFPLERQVIEDGGAGNPSLDPPWNLQTSLGLEQKIGPDVTLELTRFDSMLEDLIVGREDAFQFYTGPPPTGPLDTDPYANDGVGRVYGFEGLLKLQDEKNTAWIAATWSRSTRIKRPGLDRELFRYDQPLAITAIGSRQLPKNWRLGFRARYGSGNPYTKVDNRILDLDSRSFVPVYGPIDGDRLPAFFSLDVRIDKRWEFRQWALSAYLDIQNATNRANPELMAWSYDFEREEPITSIPTVPAFGIKAEW